MDQDAIQKQTDIQILPAKSERRHQSTSPVRPVSVFQTVDHRGPHSVTSLFTMKVPFSAQQKTEFRDAKCASIHFHSW